MTDDNPYRTPEAEVGRGGDAGGLDEKTFNHLARGQKMAIGAIVLYFLASVASAYWNPPIVGLLFIAALLLALAGLARILLGSKIHIVTKILLFVAMFIPLINILALARISHIATSELKAAGYQVGLFGAKGGYNA